MLRYPPRSGRLAGALLLLIAPLAARAQDTYIEAKTHTDAVQMMGQSVPAQDGVNRTWIGDKKIAVWDEAAGTAVILRPDLGKMYVLYPKEKKYLESAIPFQLPPEMQQAMAAMKPEVTVTPTTESKVINGFPTKLTRVKIRMMGQEIDMEYWVSTELGVSSEQVREVTQAMFAGNPMLAEMGKKMSAIEGYPVRIDTRVQAMGSTFASWQEVQKVEKRAAPPGTYDVPEGYTKTETLRMGRG